MTISRRVALCCLLLYPLGGVAPSVTAQSYCADVRFADSGACFLASPPYCADVRFANSGACFASKPAYCTDVRFANSGACSGARPAYCADVRFANSGACSGPGKPSPTKITDAARRMGSPVRARSLTNELMR